MTFATTLSLYIVRVFVLAVLGMLAGLSGLVALFDFIELLRRAATRPEATFGIVAEIAGFRLPWVAMQILPFAVLLGGILAFWRLTRSSELVVARAAGVAAWQFLFAPALCAVALGGFATSVVSPISAVMRARAVVLEERYLGSATGALTLNGGQLWLRQSDRALDPQGIAILHAATVLASTCCTLAMTFSASRKRVQGKITRNSSPPIRAHTSVLRVQSTAALATASSTLSPA